MKKRISLLIFSFLILFCYADEILFQKEGTITCNYTSSTSTYSFILSGPKDSFMLIDDVYHVKKGTIFKIQYKAGSISGGAMGGSDTNSTCLQIYKDNQKLETIKPSDKEKELVIKEEIVIEKESKIKITLTDEKSTLHEVLYLEENGTDDFVNKKTKTLLDFRGYITGGYSNFVNEPNYSVTITSDKYCNLDSEERYFSSNTVLNLTIDNARLEGGGGGGNEYAQGSVSKVNQTFITINGEEIKSSGIIKDVNDLDIKLNLSVSLNSSRPDVTILKEIILKQDNTPPSIERMKIEGSNSNWTNAGNVRLEPKGATDSESGLSHYEYREEEGGEWTRYTEPLEYSTEDGSYCNKEVYFRAVDNLGNSSESVKGYIKIDRKKPEIEVRSNKEVKKEGVTWRGPGVTVSATDGESGIKEIKEDGKSRGKEVLFNLPETGNYEISAEDAAGNTKEITVSVDNTPPSIEGMKIEGSSSNWTNAGKVRLEPKGATDREAGLSHYEYREGEIGDWTEYKEPLEYIAEDGSCCNREVNFRAVDNVGNCSENVKGYVKIDRKAPAISTSAHTEVDVKGEKWTKDSVTVSATDGESGIKEIKVGGKTVTNSYPLDTTGTYSISATDNAGNESEEKTVNIDKDAPSVTWNSPKVFSGFTYNGGKISAFSINFTVTDDDSRIPSSGDKISLMRKVSGNGTPSKAGTANGNGKETTSVSINEEEILKKLDRSQDNEFQYYVEAEDAVGNKLEENSTGNTKHKLKIPKFVELNVVEKAQEDSSQKVYRTRLDGNEVTAGILINKIDFGKYEKIVLKRTFLGDKPDGRSREEIGYEAYRELFDSNVNEDIIEQKWNENKYGEEIKLEKVNVTEVTIGGKEYWYYEDRIPVDSGLGHKGIRYQAEWEWKKVEDREDVTEYGTAVEIDKTANTPGKLTLRIEGTDATGSEARYMIFDADRDIAEGSQLDYTVQTSTGRVVGKNDFKVPENGVVKLSFRIEDPDAEPYNVQAREIVRVKYKDNTEEDMCIPIEGSNSDGRILKGTAASVYKKDGNEGTGDGWFTFDNPELILYYNKPFNMKISMEEGCKGESGAYRDITESMLIQLKAGTPDLGGFSLTVGPEAGYNRDGITAQPHQNIKLGIERNEGNTDAYSWDYGDGNSGDENDKDKEGHAYGQSDDRTGNTSEYTLTIKCMHQGQSTPYKSATVPVHIVDTQYGELKGKEVWIGFHPVTGSLTVPSEYELIIKPNDKDKSNKTEIIGLGSSVDDYRAVIKVDGTLNVEGTGDEKILFTEGKNGEKFTAISTALDEPAGRDASNKWKGIILEEGSKAEIRGAEIKYAQTGLTVNGKIDEKIENITIRNCSDTGIETTKEIEIKNAVIENCGTGLLIKENGKLSSGDTVIIRDCMTGIESEGQIDLYGMEITKKGTVGKTGLEIIKDKGSAGPFTGGITIENYENGIVMEGKHLDGGNIGMEGITGTGIKSAGIKAGSLTIKGTKGMTGIISSGNIEAAGEIEVENFASGILMEGKDLTAKKENERYGIKLSGITETGIKSGNIEAGSLSITGDGAATGLESSGNVTTGNVTVSGFGTGIEFRGSTMSCGSINVSGSREKGIETSGAVKAAGKITVTAAGGTGLEVNGAGSVESSEIEMTGDGAATGLESSGNVTTGNITVSGFETGIEFSGNKMDCGEVKVSGSSVKGIEANGKINAGTKDITVTAKGGKALEAGSRGNITCGNLKAEGTGDRGLESEGTITAGEKITVTGYKNGINNKGNIVTKEINVKAPEKTERESGILNEGTITTETVTVDGFRDKGMEIKGGSLTAEEITITGGERGLILNKGIMNRKEETLTVTITNCTTGMHLLGGTMASISGTISNCEEYGVKEDGKGTYSYEGLAITGCGRSRYKDGKAE